MAGIVQWLERLTVDQEVVGSSPIARPFRINKLASYLLLVISTLGHFQGHIELLIVKLNQTNIDTKKLFLNNQKFFVSIYKKNVQKQKVQIVS